MRVIAAFLSVFICAAPAASASAAQSTLSDRSLSMHEPPSYPEESFNYGSRSGQRIVVSSPRGRAAYPVILIPSGADFARDSSEYSGAWIQSMAWENGFAVAWIGHRPEQQGRADAIFADLPAGIAELRRRAARYRIDPDRMILLGSGSSGHFAALMGTDPRLLTQAGVPFEAVRGVVVFNGDAFDVTGRIAASGRFAAGLYRKFFGTDPARQRDRSPLAHAAAPNAPAFLFHAIENRPHFGAQADAFAAALRRAGSSADVVRVRPTESFTLATYIGAPQHPRTRELIAFLERVTTR